MAREWDEPDHVPDEHDGTDFGPDGPRGDYLADYFANLEGPDEPPEFEYEDEYVEQERSYWAAVWDRGI